jgi:hypothetical protein
MRIDGLMCRDSKWEVDGRSQMWWCKTHPLMQTVSRYLHLLFALTLVELCASRHEVGDEVHRGMRFTIGA